MRTFILIVLTAFVSASCGHSKPDPSPKVEEMHAVMLPPKSDDRVMAKMANDAPAESPITDTGKKIIKTGSISFETGSIDKTRKRILNSLQKLGGYVAEDNESHGDDSDRQEYTLKLRLPEKNFGLLLDSVSSAAVRIDSKEISIKDVTSQFIDVKAQLANSHALENTYLGLLKKAGKMGDVLQIENKLTDIRTTIDSTQGALNYLSKQVAYSSLDVTFYTKQKVPDNENTVGMRFRDAIGNGWGTLQNLFFGLISLWPVMLLVIACYLLIQRWRRRRKQRKQAVSA